MNTGTIYVVTKGGERVSLADKTSAIELINALALLDCTEPFSMTSINGNKQELPIFDTAFLDKHIKVLSMGDAERVIHWMLDFGCAKVSIENVGVKNEGKGKEL